MNHISDKGLISKIHKGLTIQYIKKWTDDLTRYFSEEYIQVASRYMKRCLMLLIIREIQIKTTMRYRLIPVRMTVIQMTRDNICC